MSNWFTLTLSYSFCVISLYLCIQKTIWIMLIMLLLLACSISSVSSVCFWLRFALVELGNYELRVCYTQLGIDINAIETGGSVNLTSTSTSSWVSSCECVIWSRVRWAQAHWAFRPRLHLRPRRCQRWVQLLLLLPAGGQRLLQLPPPLPLLLPWALAATAWPSHCAARWRNWPSADAWH